MQVSECPVSSIGPSVAPRASALASQVPRQIAPAQLPLLSQRKRGGNPAGDVTGVLYTRFLTSFVLSSSFPLDKDRLAPSLVDGMKIFLHYGSCDNFGGGGVG